MNMKIRVLLAACNSETSNTLSLYKASIAMETYAKIILQEYCSSVQGYGDNKEDVEKVYKEIEQSLNN